LCGACYKRARERGMLPPRTPLKTREQKLAVKRAKYYRNRERICTQTRASQKRHREAGRSRVQRRRARLAGTNSPGVSASDWRAIVKAFCGKCVYCGRNDLPLTRDHKTPIARGGLDDFDNVIPACGPCNSSKGTRTFEEYIAVLYAF
jgi:5-methylcytosine-specific restriction endonuclease McrA